MAFVAALLASGGFFGDHSEAFWPGVAAKYHGLRSANAVD